jgi:hypothetical protein
MRIGQVAHHVDMLCTRNMALRPVSVPAVDARGPHRLWCHVSRAVEDPDIGIVKMRLEPRGADQIAGLMVATHLLLRRGIDLSLLGARGRNDQNGRRNDSSDLNKATIDQCGQQTAANIKAKPLQTKHAGIDRLADPGKSEQVIERQTDHRHFTGT